MKDKVVGIKTLHAEERRGKKKERLVWACKVVDGKRKKRRRRAGRCVHKFGVFLESCWPREASSASCSIHISGSCRVPW